MGARTASRRTAPRAQGKADRTTTNTTGQTPPGVDDGTGVGAGTVATTREVGSETGVRPRRDGTSSPSGTWSTGVDVERGIRRRTSRSSPLAQPSLENNGHGDGDSKHDESTHTQTQGLATPPPATQARAAPEHRDRHLPRVWAGGRAAAQVASAETTERSGTERSNQREGNRTVPTWSWPVSEHSKERTGRRYRPTNAGTRQGSRNQGGGKHSLPNTTRRPERTQHTDGWRGQRHRAAHGRRDSGHRTPRKQQTPEGGESPSHPPRNTNTNTNSKSGNQTTRGRGRRHPTSTDNDTGTPATKNEHGPEGRPGGDTRRRSRARGGELDRRSRKSEHGADSTARASITTLASHALGAQRGDAPPPQGRREAGVAEHLATNHAEH